MLVRRAAARRKLIALSGLLALACACSEGLAQATAYIGFMAPRSGSNRERGESMINGAQMAVDELNRRKPKIGGAPVSFGLLAQDDRYNPHTGEFIARYFVKRGVIAALCHSSTVCIASAPVLRQAGIAQISVGATNPQFTQAPGGLAFRLLGHSAQGGALFGQYAYADMKLSRIAVIDDQTPSGAAMADHFAAAFVQAGGDVVLRESVNHKTSDFNHALAAIKARSVEAIFWGGTYQQAADMMVRARGLGLRVRFLNAMNGMNNRYFLGRIASDAGNIYTLESDQPRARLAGWKDFERAYAARFPDSFIDVSALRAYDAVLMTGQAALAADSLAPGKLAEALHRESMKGLTGQISFDQAGNLRNPVFSVYQSDGGDWKALKTMQSN